VEKSKIKIWELALLLALCVSLLEASVEVGRQSALSEKIVRLHVVADSDTAEAQALKIRVRDAVLAEIEPLLVEVDSAGEALRRIEEGRDDIVSAAARAAGGEQVELRLGRESYGYRQSGSYALPAGEYNSLRIILGEGEGHNWWGVIFPQLDTSGGYAEAAKYLSDEELAIVFEEDSVTVRFRFLEILEKLRLWMK